MVVRQVLTLLDNARLTRQQADALEDLQVANQRIEEQSRVMAIHNAELEHGIEHLKDVQANLANGNVRARARLTSGALLPLAASLNLMAERLIRLWQTSVHAQHLVTALGDLCNALDNHWKGERLVIPDSCGDLIEIHRLLRSMRINTLSAGYQTVTQPLTNQPLTQPVTPRPVTHLFSSQLEGTPQAASNVPRSPFTTNQPKRDGIKKEEDRSL